MTVTRIGETSAYRLDGKNIYELLEEIFHNKFSREHLLDAWNAIIGDENSEIGPFVDAVQ